MRTVRLPALFLTAIAASACIEPSSRRHPFYQDRPFFDTVYVHEWKEAATGRLMGSRIELKVVGAVREVWTLESEKDRDGQWVGGEFREWKDCAIVDASNWECHTGRLTMQDGQLRRLSHRGVHTYKSHVKFFRKLYPYPE